MTLNIKMFHVKHNKRTDTFVSVLFVWGGELETTLRTLFQVGTCNIQQKYVTIVLRKLQELF